MSYRITGIGGGKGTYAPTEVGIGYTAKGDEGCEDNFDNLDRGSSA